MLDEAFDRAAMALRRAAKSAPLSILVDPTLRDPTKHDVLLASELQRAIKVSTASQYRLPHIHDDFDPERCPFLIHVSSEPEVERVVAAAIRIATAEACDAESPEFTGRTVCGFIVHDTHPAQRAQALARAARVFKPDGRRHYLRFWDPRVCQHLPRHLPSAHWAHIRSSMGQWIHFDPLRQLVEVPTSGAMDVTRQERSDVQTHTIDDLTWKRLERIAPLNKLLGLSWDWGLLPTQSLALQIDELVERSTEHGFDSEQDVLVFAACGLTGHPKFDRHPQVQDALRGAAAAGAPLQSALDRFNEAFWDTLRTDTRWLNDQRTEPQYSEINRVSR